MSIVNICLVIMMSLTFVVLSILLIDKYRVEKRNKKSIIFEDDEEN